jgi:Transposase DDE domain
LTGNSDECYHVGLYIARVPNRKSHPTILLRESWREGARVKNRTLANLTHWPAEKIEALDQVLKGRTSFGPPLPEAFEITRSRPHGHALAVLGTIRQLKLEQLLASGPQRQLVIAMVAQRLLEPGSKLATARALRPETAHSSRGEQLGLDAMDEDQLYAAMDWLLPPQPTIEQALAHRHLSEGTLVLYDVTSTYFAGHCCPLAQYGYSRDERRGNPQIVLGMLTNDEGCPVACEVFEGNTADPKTVASQIDKLRTRFGLQQIVLVGDRGMLTQARIETELRPVAGLEWITALRSVQIRELVSEGAWQLSLFDRTDLAEITHPDYPGERLIVCRNPWLAQARARQREELMQAAEEKLAALAAATQRPPRHDPQRISFRVGTMLGPMKVAKYFEWQLTEQGLSYQRNQARIERDAALDGIYVRRTSRPAERLGTPQTVVAYKRLARVERLFRILKSPELELRPIHHWLTERVRAHVLLCLLASYVEWHMRRALAPLWFDDEDSPDTTAAPVAPAHCSPAAPDQARRQHTIDQLPAQSFRALLRHLATIVKNRIEPTLKSIPPFDMITRPDALQQRALQQLRLSPRLLAT